MSTDSQPSIAIVGGGPSGLCIGVLLHKRGVPFTIYELRDEPVDAALTTPSGMLDLHEESGLAAIRGCGLWDEFQAFTHDCSEELIVRNSDGKITHTDNGGPDQRPEIARNSLSHLLLSHAPAENIKWGHKLLSATRASGGKITLDFGPNGTVAHDFVVGADGAWSKIRNILTDVKPHYGGIQYLTLDIINASTRYPEISALVGTGSSFILGNKNGITTHRGVQDSIRLYIGVGSDDETPFHKSPAGLDAEQLKKKLISDPALFGSWDKAIHDLICAAVDDSAAIPDNAIQMSEPKPLYMLPIGHKWEAQPGLALVGDAAHLMMPWAGEGVNLALWDSLDLSDAIAKGWEQTKDPAEFQRVMVSLVSEFDQQMYARSSRAAEETWNNSKMLFSDNGAQAFADIMASMGPPGEGPEGGA